MNITPEEFKAKVEKILDGKFYVCFDKLHNETTVEGLASRISFDELLSLSKLTNSNSIVYKTEIGYYGDISHGITIYGFSLFEES